MGQRASMELSNYALLTRLILHDTTQRRRYSSNNWELESEIWVQIRDETICILLRTNIPGKYTYSLFCNW